MGNLENTIKPYSKAIVRLLKGTVERSSSIWEDILLYQHEIQEYLGVIGLELMIQKDEGYAFVTQLEDSDGSTLGLVTRRQIGFETSIVLVVLRQSLEEFDSNPTQYQGSEKFITNTEIKDQLELFLQAKLNKVKFLKELDNYIKRIVELGYLKEVNKKETETQYQIQRIIKDKITLDTLQEFKTKLEGYVKSV